MTPLLYVAVAIIAAFLATRSYIASREEPSRKAFLGLGWAIAISYASFSLSLLPGFEFFRIVHMGASAFVPATALLTFDRIFEHPNSRSPTRLVVGLTMVLAPVLTLLHAFISYDGLSVTTPQMVGGTLGFVAMALAIARLWEAHHVTNLDVERVRLRYLIGVTTGAAVFTLLEQATRLGGVSASALEVMSLSARVDVLQGPLPPFSVIFTGIAIYLVHHILVLSRLLDLHELISRTFALLISAALLVMVDGATLYWVDTFSTTPQHSAFQLFIASLLFLAAYNPLQPTIEWASSRLINQRGQRLQATLTSLLQSLPAVISKEGLAEMLLSNLNASGRVSTCSVYLWDPRVAAFACHSFRGSEQRPLKAVASGVFEAGLQEGSPWYARSTLMRQARTDERAAEILALLDAMKSDLAMPFLKGGAVLGWLNLRDESWSDGFSADEILKLEEVAELSSVVLGNIRDFQQLQERDRLAALGQMAAGLAHEIRNPLAGVKGAAQFLQSEKLSGDSGDMLQVIIDEANRLDRVVRQFLDYARPFELDLHLEPVNATVTHVLTLVRASGIPANIDIVEDLSGDLPRLMVDSPQLSQVLLNLLQNALQAMPDGGTLTVRTQRIIPRVGPELAQIEITDTGVGIPADSLEQLFIPFFTTKATGTGLGLSICQRIITAHRGELDLQSVEGQGASFFVRLPLPEVVVEAPA